MRGKAPIETAPRQHGFTALEMMLALAILGIMGLVIARYNDRFMHFFRRYDVRRQLTSESRLCLDTMTQILRNGKPETVVIDTTDEPGVVDPVFDRIQFQTRDGKAHQFRWSNSPPNSVHWSATGMQERKLASNVVGLSFKFDPPDLVFVDLIMDAPYDARADSTMQIFMPNIPIKMEGS